MEMSLSVYLFLGVFGKNFWGKVESLLSGVGAALGLLKRVRSVERGKWVDDEDKGKRERKSDESQQRDEKENPFTPTRTDFATSSSISRGSMVPNLAKPIK